MKRVSFFHSHFSVFHMFLVVSVLGMMYAVYGLGMVILRDDHVRERVGVESTVDPSVLYRKKLRTIIKPLLVEHARQEEMFFVDRQKFLTVLDEVSAIAVPAEERQTHMEAAMLLGKLGAGAGVSDEEYALQMLSSFAKDHAWIFEEDNGQE